MNKLLSEIKEGAKQNKFYTAVLLILIAAFSVMQYKGYVLFSSQSDKEVTHNGSSTYHHK